MTRSKRSYGKKKKLFVEIDTDKSGEIDFFEFQTCFINDSSILTPEVCTLAFRLLDKVKL